MQKRFKIGIDARMFSDSFTGIGRYTFELTKRFFEDSSLPIDWVLFLNEPEFSQYTFFAPHVRSVCVGAKHYSLAEQTRFLKILNTENCDLVHFTHFNVPLLYNRKFVVTIHDTTISFYPGKKMNSWVRKKAYEKVISHAILDSFRVIAVSENTKRDIVRLFSADPAKIVKIWNGIGDEFGRVSDVLQDVVRQKYGLFHEFLLYTGVWREHKNLVRLLLAFRKILDRTARIDGPYKLADLKLVLTGNEDPYYPEVKRTISELDLENHIVLTGLVDREELISLYSAATAFVFPSLYEGFGMPPLEAMKCHTPVVCSKTSSLPEVCGNAATYFDPFNVSDMTEKILRVLIDSEYREDLIRKGVERASLFSWDLAAKETLKIYFDALK